MYYDFTQIVLSYVFLTKLKKWVDDARCDFHISLQLNFSFIRKLIAVIDCASKMAMIYACLLV